MTNSRAKGARGERELANLLKEYGYECRRGQQFSGANGDADVVGLPQPVVMHRKDRHPWLVTMSMGDFMEMYSKVNGND